MQTVQTIDLPKTLASLREDRGGLIETAEEYRYVYKAASFYARNIHDDASDDNCKKLERSRQLGRYRIRTYMPIYLFVFHVGINQGIQYKVPIIFRKLYFQPQS